MSRNSETQSQKSSLLFFGVIARHTQQDYLQKMKALMASDADMYEQMTIDLHNQGIILRRKYNLLQITPSIVYNRAGKESTLFQSIRS